MLNKKILNLLVANTMSTSPSVFTFIGLTTNKNKHKKDYAFFVQTKQRNESDGNKLLYY
jgi:hypothetical protein